MHMEAIMTDPHTPFILGSWLVAMALLGLETILVIRRRRQAQRALQRARQRQGAM